MCCCYEVGPPVKLRNGGEDACGIAGLQTRSPLSTRGTLNNYITTKTAHKNRPDVSADILDDYNTTRLIFN